MQTVLAVRLITVRDGLLRGIISHWRMGPSQFLPSDILLPAACSGPKDGKKKKNNRRLQSLYFCKNIYFLFVGLSLQPLFDCCPAPRLEMPSNKDVRTLTAATSSSSTTDIIQLIYQMLEKWQLNETHYGFCLHHWARGLQPGLL